MPSTDEKLRLFVSAPAGIAERLQSELSALGVSRAHVLGAGVQCRATLTEAYRVCLWSRLASRVLLVGAGGLGSPAALYLAAAGVGTLGVIDDDIVDRSNLQRQILHTDDRVGRPKVESARETLACYRGTASD